MSWAGASLVSLAFLLFVVDLKVIGHGLPSFWGAISLVLGVSMLVWEIGPYSWVALVILAGVMVLTGVLFMGSLSEALATRGRPATTGAEGMIGEVGVVREPVGADSPGWVFVHGELWRAVAAVAAEEAHGQDYQRVIGAGRKVQVVGLRDGKVVVMPLESTVPA